MAGIGFELKRIFKRGSIISMVRGAVYAAITTIGPAILVIILLLSMYIFLNFSDMSYYDKDLLGSIILYVFIFSLITTAPLNSVLSRYIADKIYEEKHEDILPSFYTGLAVNMGISALLGIPFAVHMFMVGKIPIMTVLGGYCFYAAMTFIFFSMTYISALKEYKKIALSFLAGVLFAFGSAYIAITIFNSSIFYSILYGFTAGFTLIALLLLSQIRLYFHESSKNYLEIFTYIKKFKLLFFTNLFYILGLYAHNFVVWAGTDMRVVIAKSFVHAPMYDMASCIAMFTSISTLVIFVAQVEVNFYEKYQAYLESVIGGTGADIDLNKKEMFRTQTHEIAFIISLQFIISTILLILAVTFLPRLGFSGTIMDVYATLATGYFLVFIMYCLIIFLYYYNDIFGAFITALCFFATTLLGTLIIINIPGISTTMYGTGLVIGGYVGWSVGFFRLRYICKNLDYHIFCKGIVVETVVDSNL